jgi:hypothetical protein
MGLAVLLVHVLADDCDFVITYLIIVLKLLLIGPIRLHLQSRFMIQN